MTIMTNILKKQLQLLEIELGDYTIAKSQSLPYSMPETYYAGIAHAIKGLRFSLNSLQKIEEKEQQNGTNH